MARDLNFGIRLRADGSGFVGEMRASSDAVKKFGRDAGDAARDANRAGDEIGGSMTRAVAIGSTLGTVIGTVLVRGAEQLYASFRQAVSALDDLNDSAQGLGVSASALSSMEISARAAGVGSGQLSQALTQLNRRMVDVQNGGERSAAIFNALGISVVDANGSLRSTQEVLNDVSNKFSQYADGANKSALAQELFGRSGAKLIAFLNEGSEGLTKFGGASEESIAAAARLQGEVDRLSASWERLKLNVMGAIAAGVFKGAEYGAETAVDQLARLGRQIDEVRQKMARTEEPELLAAWTTALEGLEDQAERVRRQVEQLSLDRFVAGGNALRGAGQRAEAPNVEKQGRGGGRAPKMELVGPPEKVIAEQYRDAQRELEKLLATFEKYDAAQGKQLISLAEGNEKLREQNEEIGLSAYAVDELRARRLDDAAATKEQQIAIMGLTGERSEDIVRMQKEVALLRERAGLVRQGSAARQVGDTRKEIDDAAKRSIDEQKAASQEVGRLLGDALMRGFERGENVAENFVNSFANMLRTRVIQALSDALIQKLLSEISGGGGSSGLFDFIGNAFVNAFGAHDGAIVGGTPSFTRRMGAGAFAGAPRYHGGGIAGEVPAILKRGEGVFTQEQMRALAPVGGGMPTVNIYNNAGAQVQTRPGDDGMSLDVIISAVEDRLAGNLAGGRGALAPAMEGAFGLRRQAR
jgi:hypothetical protein